MKDEETDHMPWTRAIHLIHWADTQDSRHQLPALIRRLIRATVPGGKILNFPAGEQVQRPGLDGVVEVAQGNQFVPAGRSAWEMGVTKGMKGKADHDFVKRTQSTPPHEQAETTFVFVTPRAWKNKDKWQEEKRDESKWKDVVVWDANDLEHWIEVAPRVDVWLSVLMGRRPAGVIDTARHWSALAAIADVPLKPRVFLSSRESTIDSVTQFLEGPPSSAFLRSGGPDDGIDFLAALIEDSGTDDVDLDRVLIVTEVEAWRHLALSQEPLVLVAASSLQLSATDVSDAVHGGHHVLVTGSIATAPGTATIPLPRQDHFELYEGLTDCGFDDARARTVSKGCCGSSTILKRLITQHTDRVFPKWSQDDFRTTLAPFALIGGWVNVDPEPPKEKDPLGLVADPPLDLSCLEKFGLSRSEVESAVARWSVGVEPLFIHFRNSVLVSSREDAWFLLAGSLSREQLQRFEDIAVLILGEDDPALELDPDKRWMANIYGKVHSLSGELRRSIVESLALMSTYPTAIEPPPTVDFHDTVARVLERIFPQDAPWQRWASLGGNLPLLFECDPEFFLSRIEGDLRAESRQLPQLFQDQSNSLFGSSLHCNLLWALEGLAWSPDYIGRATVALAQLAARVPAGQSGNHPANSLSEIFVLWMAHTNATADQRVQAIEGIVQVEADVGWNLITSLLPSTLSGHSMPTHMPRWRPWAHGWKRERVSAETSQYASRFGDLVLRLAGTSMARWSQIADGMLRLGGTYTDSTIARLEEMASSQGDNTDECFPLWDKLRELTNLHSRHPDARWAFGEDTLNNLARIRDKLAPQDSVLKNHWLFKTQVHLPDIDEREFEKHDKALERRRVEALRTIVADQAFEDVQALLARADDFRAIGWIIGPHKLLTWSELGLPATLETDKQPLRICAPAYCASRFENEGWPFVESLPLGEWTPQQVVKLGICLPFAGETWDWIASISLESETRYWKQCRTFLRTPTMEEIDFAVEKLLKAGRPFSAATLVQNCMRRDCEIDSGRILNLLEAGLAVRTTEDAEQMNLYAIQELIKLLQDAEGVDQSRLAKIEWGYLPLLDRHSSQTTPKTLVRSLQTEPEFFVDLLKVQYRADDEEPGDNPMSERDRSIAELAHDLLEQFSGIPGQGDDGAIDEAALTSWVDEVRERASTVKRLGICDFHIGKLFAHVPLAEGSPLFDTVVVAMERIGTDDLFDGFSSGVISNRGVTSRSPTTGGGPERDLAAKYQGIANSIRPNSPKVAEAFDQLVCHYERDAEWHDVNAERRRLGR